MNFGKTVLILTAALLLGLAPAPRPAAAAGTPGSRVPSFALPSVEAGKPIDIRDYQGKVVLVTFWATWCGPCMQEVPSLINLNKQYGPQGFNIIGVSMDQGGSGIVKKVIRKTGINYPVVMGNAKLSRDFGGIFGIPTAFLVDRSGTILKRYTGWVSHDVLAKDIEAAIK